MDAATRLYGVIGHPVEASLSPAMHNAAFATLGLNAVYLAFDVESDRLGAALGAMRVLGVAGLNVTIPHKEAVVPWLDRLTPDAERAGSVNTIALTDAALVGHTTDGTGFLRAVADEGVEVGGRRVLVLGAGGAARAIIAAVRSAGAATVVVLNRTRARAEALAHDLAARTAGPKIQVEDLSRVSDARFVAEADILVNTTPPAEGGVTVPIVFPAGRSDLFVFDAVYRPATTPLVAGARRAGLRAVTGLGMLVHQGALSLTVWTGREAPYGVMRDAAESVLAAERTGVPASPA